MWDSYAPLAKISFIFRQFFWEALSLVNLEVQDSPLHIMTSFDSRRLSLKTFGFSHNRWSGYLTNLSN